MATSPAMTGIVAIVVVIVVVVVVVIVMYKAGAGSWDGAIDT